MRMMDAYIVRIVNQSPLYLRAKVLLATSDQSAMEECLEFAPGMKKVRRFCLAVNCATSPGNAH